MQRTTGQRILLVLAILFAAIPVLFALIRAVTTGSDLRAVWMAAAAFPAAAVMTAIWKRNNSASSLSLGILLFVVCTLIAAAVAVLLGAHAAFGVLAVAGTFGFCIAAATVLMLRSSSVHSD